MIASLRFKGLDVDAGVGVSLEPSPSLESAWLTGALISRLKAILVLLSKLFRSTGLVLALFSCPLADPADELGGAFPASDAWLKTRFMGLRGEVRVRDEGRGGAVFARPEERKANFALGGNGTANGDGVCGGLLVFPVKMVG
jgi:hypothetical protein